jgi:tetratricopeptide (TPR) repeat protein
LQNSEELSGSHAVQLPSVPGDVNSNPVSSKDLRQLLSARTAGLENFIIGLGYFALDRFEQALGSFLKAEASWPTNEEADPAKKIIYLFLGHATLKLSPQDFSHAGQYYEEALQLDDQFARARLSLAELQFVETMGHCQPGQIDPQEIAQVIASYKEVAGTQGESDLAEIPVKASLLLGRAYTCISLAQAANDWQDSRDEYNQVIEEYKSRSIGPERDRINDVAAEAYAGLGLIEYSNAVGSSAALQKAATYYDQAIQLSYHKDRQSVFYLWRAEIALQNPDCTQAQDFLSQAEKIYAEWKKLNDKKIPLKDLEAFQTQLQNEYKTKCS